MPAPLTISEVHAQESLKDFAERTRKHEFNCKSLPRVFALSRAIRRAARLGIDPEYADALIAFDADIDNACRELSRILKNLINLRERIDQKKIDEEREARRRGTSRIEQRKRLMRECKPPRVGSKERPLRLEDVREKLAGLDAKEVEALLKWVNEELAK